MNLKRLIIRGFRGIRELDWILSGRTICLVGPGDSTKTTILEAIEWVLSPRWTVPASDADFYAGDAAEPIVIEATVGDLTAGLLSDQKYGLEQRGWGDDGLHDEPEEADEPVITIRLTIDDSLEPRWEVVNERQAEPRQISARDRESLGATRLGPDVERHLTWGRGSALLRLTDSTEEMSRTLAAAHRLAREHMNAAEMVELNKAAAQASNAAKAFGAGASQGYTPALDPAAMGVGATAVALHEGAVPVRAAGLGSRRLAALAVQRASFAQGGLVLVDEVETGLEPHRLRHLVRELRTAETGQVVMTTHSEVAIVELVASELCVVTSQNGATALRVVPEAVQGAIRAAPEALLGRKVIVGEGATEVGLCRALDRRWTETHDDVPPAHLGVVLVPGGGAEAVKRALTFASLGYRTALVVDSDVPLQPPEAEITAQGVTLFTWDGEVCTEERICLDVPWDTLVTILERAANVDDLEAANASTDAVAARLDARSGTGLQDWIEGGAEKDAIRRAIGDAANKKGWFKRTDRGETLGKIVADALPKMEGTDLRTKLDALAAWAYAP